VTKKSELKKLRLLFPGITLALLVILFGCSRPDFRTFSNPVMTTDDMQTEMERLHEINLTVASGDFDPSIYPVIVGIDSRNGKMLVEKFICWDVCPEVGMVFLLYLGVDSMEACADMVAGASLFSPEAIPTEYWGCRPVVDWLNLPASTPN
jgi:hypothetical protein